MALAMLIDLNKAPKLPRIFIFICKSKDKNDMNAKSFNYQSSIEANQIELAQLGALDKIYMFTMKT